jgi:hypothetical protein
MFRFRFLPSGIDCHRVMENGGRCVDLHGEDEGSHSLLEIVDSYNRP